MGFISGSHRSDVMIVLGYLPSICTFVSQTD